jgi:hypothetical protein
VHVITGWVQIRSDLAALCAEPAIMAPAGGPQRAGAHPPRGQAAAH